MQVAISEYLPKKLVRYKVSLPEMCVSLHLQNKQVESNLHFNTGDEHHWKIAPISLAKMRVIPCGLCRFAVMQHNIQLICTSLLGGNA